MFESVRQKLERANEHVRDLASAFKPFSHGRPHRVRIQGHIDRGVSLGISLIVVFDADLPSSIALLLGDAIHNLRAALDHATWELIGLDGGTQNRFTNLPTGDNWQNYKPACFGMITPRSDTKQFLADLAIHDGGAGESIYKLRLRDNADKYRLVTPVAHFSSVSGVTLINLRTGDRYDAPTLLTGTKVGGKVIGLDGDWALMQTNTFNRTLRYSSAMLKRFQTSLSFQRLCISLMLRLTRLGISRCSLLRGPDFSKPSEAQPTIRMILAN